MLSEEALEERRAYYRAWRRKNQDKEREYKERYWNKRAHQQWLEEQDHVHENR